MLYVVTMYESMFNVYFVHDVINELKIDNITYTSIENFKYSLNPKYFNLKLTLSFEKNSMKVTYR